MTDPQIKLDETIPGGRYLNATEDRWIDANGVDLGLVTCTPDCGCDDVCAKEAGADAPAKRTRTKRAADR